jgi:DNA repair protein RadC
MAFAQLSPLIRELPPDERPRERLLAQGARALGDAELVAVLLRTGRPGASALDMARETLAAVGGIAGMAAGGAPLLLRRGLGEAKAASLLAAIEIGRRLARGEAFEKAALGAPAAVASYLALRYGVRDQEVMGALYLDTRHRLIAERDLYRGTINRAAVEPRAILKEGLLHGACGLVVFHTHPSGDPSPSAEDLAFTRRLAEAGELVGIRLVDHLILGGVGRWTSLRERGAW